MRDTVEARTARGNSSIPSAGQGNLEQWAVPGSGLRSLLQQLRRADRSLYQHSLQDWR